MSSFGKWYEEQKQGEEGGASSGSWFSDTFNTDQLLPLYEGMNAPVDLQSLRESMESRMPKKIMGMGYQQRFKVFSALILLSVLFFALAFGVGMPVITFRPQKFAISFTMGSLLFMGSFAILKGPYEHLKSMCQGDIFFTTVYFTTMFATLYFTFNTGGPKGYIMVLGASGAQLMALLYYLVSFLPGGAAGLRLLTAAMWRLLQPVFMMCARFQAICLARCCSFWYARSFGSSSQQSSGGGDAGSS